LLDPVREAIKEVRQTATDLHPASLDDLGLVPTLNWLCRQLGEMRAELTIERHFYVDEDKIPRELQPILFRIAEEACRVYKSAVEVRRIGVSIHTNHEQIVMELRDNALPPYFDDVPPHPYHRIDDRALLSGGTFSSRTNSWGGLSATIVWDLTLPAARPRW
jgi:two-component system NarL family sensor kinase